MEKGKLIYKGETKNVYSTCSPKEIIIAYRDETTAFRGMKRAEIKDKGKYNNLICEMLLTEISKIGVPTHFIKRLNDYEQLCKYVDIIPLKVIVRNYSAGTMAKKLNLEEGKKCDNVVYELNYKNDSFEDHLINDHHAVMLNLVTYDELDIIYNYAKKINERLVNLFNKINIILVDFKIEFGRLNKKEIILADGISPDSARMWDMTTLKKLDKDRFRRDLGDVIEGYIEIYDRLKVGLE